MFLLPAAAGSSKILGVFNNKCFYFVAVFVFDVMLSSTLLLSLTKYSNYLSCFSQSHKQTKCTSIRTHLHTSTILFVRYYWKCFSSLVQLNEVLLKTKTHFTLTGSQFLAFLSHSLAAFHRSHSQYIFIHSMYINNVTTFILSCNHIYFIRGPCFCVSTFRKHK